MRIEYEDNDNQSSSLEMWIWWGLVALQSYVMYRIFETYERAQTLYSELPSYVQKILEYILGF